MSNTSQPTAQQLESRAEDRIAAKILAVLAVVVLLVVGAVYLWGLPALTMIALGAAVLVMLILVAYAAGV